MPAAATATLIGLGIAAAATIGTDGTAAAPATMAAPDVSGAAGDCLLQTLWVLRGHSAADCQHCNVPFIHFNNNLAAAIGA